MTEELRQRLDLHFGQNEDITDYEGLVVSFHKNPAATRSDIVSTIGNNHIKLPEDYCDFLQIFDGCTLFKYQDLGGFEFLGTKDIAKENVIQQQTYLEDWDNNLIVFCRLIADGDFISFRSRNDDKYDILDCYHDEIPEKWTVIGNSFDGFLERLIIERGRRFWL